MTTPLFVQYAPFISSLLQGFTVGLSLVFQAHSYAAALGINPLAYNSHRGHLVCPKRLGEALKGGITKSWWWRGQGKAKFDGVEESEFQAESNDAKARRLMLEAEALQLQAKRLHLEADKERLLIAQNDASKSMKKVIEQDETILQIIAAAEYLYSTLSDAWKRGKLKDELMMSFEKIVDVELFLRMSDLAETGKVAREDLVGVSRAVMSVVNAIDSKAATKLRDAINQCGGITQRWGNASNGVGILPKEKIQREGCILDYEQGYRQQASRDISILPHARTNGNLTLTHVLMGKGAVTLEHEGYKPIMCTPQILREMSLREATHSLNHNKEGSFVAFY